jgi:peptidoglycan/LPS O-acetylase OafA/YrhL
MHRSTARFLTLDGIRGLAAIAVSIYHLSNHRILSSAWIAVDLFFILSGFVIFHSYATRIEDGMTFGSFWKIRMKRLAPLYFIGLSIGIVAAWLLEQGSDPSALWWTIIPAVFFLPYIQSSKQLIDGSLTAAFPINGPGWSLFFELIANIAFYYSKVRLAFKSKFVIFSLASAYAFLVYLTDQYNAGWATGNLWLGLIRVFTLFCIGIAIYQGALTPKTISISMRYAVVFGFFLVMISTSKHAALIASVCWAPFVISIAKDIEPPDCLRRACAHLGEISYPLYITHYPIFKLVSSLDALNSTHIVLRTALCLAPCLLAAMAFNRLDHWVRGFFRS